MAKDPLVEDLLQEVSAGIRGCLSGDGLAAYSASLEELLELAEDHQLRQRTRLLNRLEKWILDAQAAGHGRCLCGVRGLSLQAFGSSVMGISSRGGDLDISVEGSLQDARVSRSGHLTDADRRFRGDLLGEVHQTLQAGRHFRPGKSTQLIRTAKVPVSKFVEAETGIHCDLSIGNSIGVFKSLILGEVLGVDRRVRDLVVMVKKWAKANEVNDPSMGTFNSYCLTLLVISFVQTRTPPLLPPFRDLFPDLRATISQHGASTGGPSLLSEIERFKEMARAWGARNDRERNQQTLFELLLEFLASFSLLAAHSQLMHYTAEGRLGSGLRPTASPWEGGFTSVRWDGRAIKKYHFFVEDPFEAQDNCARTLATQDWWFVCKLLQQIAEEAQNFRNAPAEEKSRQWSRLSLVVFGKRLSASAPGSSQGSDNGDVRLLSGHRKALFVHLNKFKSSDRKFVAFSNSWCSVPVRKLLTSVVQELGLYMGKGPKRKLIISKDGNLKEDMVEHAVNSTLKVRRPKTPIDPMYCVVKQRLREFLKCSLRLHIFHTSKFEPEVKAWIASVIEGLDLQLLWLEDGNLRIEVPPSMDRHAVQACLTAELAGVERSPNGLQAFGQQEEPQILGQDEDNNSWPAEFGARKEHDVDEEESDEVHHSCGESVGHKEEHAGPIASDEQCTGQAEEYASLQLVAKTDNRIVVKIKTGHRKAVPEHCNGAITEHKEHSLGRPSAWTALDHVQDELEPQGSAVLAKLSLCCAASDDAKPIGNGEVHADRPAPVAKFAGSTGDMAAQPGGVADKSDSSPRWRGSSEDTRLNADILRGVLYDLFDELSAFRQSKDPEAVIDPTAYVVPVGWVRQQVRDIARALSLAVEKPSTTKRQMKMRVWRRAAGDDSNSDDDEWELQRQRGHPHEVHNMVDQSSRLQMGTRRRSADMQASAIPNVYHHGFLRHEDHLFSCFNWVRKMNSKSNGKAFWAAGYTPEVQRLICERAEDNGLCASVRDGRIWMGTVPDEGQAQLVQRMDSQGYRLNLESLNREIMVGVYNHLFARLQEMKQQGFEQITIDSGGFIMKPEWVVEQTAMLAAHLGSLHVGDDTNGIMKVVNVDVAKRRSLDQGPRGLPPGFVPADAHQVLRMLPRAAPMRQPNPHSMLGPSAANEQAMAQARSSHAGQMPRARFPMAVSEPPTMAPHKGTAGRVCGFNGHAGQSERLHPMHSVKSAGRHRPGASIPAANALGPYPGNAGLSMAEDPRGFGGPQRHWRGGEGCAPQEGRGSRGRRGGGRGGGRGRRSSEDTNSGKSKGQRR
eukprot:evm.model.scf_2042.1 EVM.evm.TU.scf_2042.1   scf_2042:14397-18281(-)